MASGGRAEEQASLVCGGGEYRVEVLTTALFALII